ncbi:hypothetical protein [Micromonospora sp. NPDC049301]|uniref:hypothetical protein n=1 Tax=Micromonospora sp. NPDC049301 TaxID=3155723 RepID=UPI00341954F0
MTDLDERIVHTLRERAEGGVDTDRLLAAAVARGRTRVRRRRAAAGAMLSVVALLGAGVAAGAVGVHGVIPAIDPDVPSESGRPVAVVPPLADGVPGAAARPDMVGADPNLLHIGIARGGPRFLSWAVQAGVEVAQFDAGGRTVTLELAASAEALRLSPPEGLSSEMAELLGRSPYDGTVSSIAAPNGARRWLLHWRPTPGLYARADVVAPEDGELHTVANSLRLDQAYHCGGPLRLTAVPAGAEVTSCEVKVASFPAGFDVLLSITSGIRAGIAVRLNYAASIVASRTEGNLTIGGRAAYRSPIGALELLGFPRAHLTAVWMGDAEADAATVLGGAQVAEHLDQPETW